MNDALRFVGALLLMVVGVMASVVFVCGLWNALTPDGKQLFPSSMIVLAIVGAALMLRDNR